MSLRQKTFSAVRWTTFDALGKALLTIASLSVLARILAPEDYGLMAIVTVILGFAGLFADIGINAAFVQRKDVTDEQRASLFWLNVFVSIVLALIVVGLSPIIAELYGEPRLAILISVSASVFILRALGQQVRMAAEKELKFRAVVTLELAAAFIGFFVAVLAALAGWGVLALVLSGVTAAAFSTLFFWLFISAGWRPALYLRVSDIRSFAEIRWGVDRRCDRQLHQSHGRCFSWRKTARCRCLGHLQRSANDCFAVGQNDQRSHHSGRLSTDCQSAG